jgi:hypothetical protein
MASNPFTDVIAEVQKAPQNQRTDKLIEGITDAAIRQRATATIRSGTRHRQATVGKGLSTAARVNAHRSVKPLVQRWGFFRLLVTVCLVTRAPSGFRSWFPRRNFA